MSSEPNTTGIQQQDRWTLKHAASKQKRRENGDRVSLTSPLTSSPNY